eukprot:TRINITY_DN99115_c0_g1_i1.p1 TRINITY_DN99115_c0_g1~~TRINITY_DN99115_c0_g1_i1.p1  ORF type:complete len:142 (-),score=4.81 TRINITY_DN99115_c0_g1_i1:267-692(-)
MSCSYQFSDVLIYSGLSLALGLVIGGFLGHFINKLNNAMNSISGVERQLSEKQIFLRNNSYVVVKNVNGLTQQLAQVHRQQQQQEKQSLQIRKQGSRKLREAMQQGSTIVRNISPNNSKIQGLIMRVVDSLLRLPHLSVVV